MAFCINVEGVTPDLFHLSGLDPANRAFTANTKMVENDFSFRVRKLSAELIVNQREFTPKAEIGLVVVVNIRGADDVAFGPVRSEVPGGDLEQDLFRFVKINGIA